MDFDAKVPIPFSVFPSSYRSDAVEETTEVKVEGEINQRVGRDSHEARYSSFSASLPGRKDRTQYTKEEVKVHEDDRERRPRRKEDVTIYEEEDHHPREHLRHRDRTEVEFSRER